MTSLYHGLALGKNGVISFVGAGGKTSLMFRLAHELSASGDTVLTTTTTKIIAPTKEQSRFIILSDSPSEILNKAVELLQRTPHISAASRYVSEHEKLIGFPPETIGLFQKSGIFRWIIVEADGAARRPLKVPAPHEPVIPDCTDLVVGVVGLSAIGQPLSKYTVFRPKYLSKITGLSEGMEIVSKTVGDILTHRQGIFQGTPVGARQIAFLNQADIAGKAQAGRSVIQYLALNKITNISRVVIGSTFIESPVLEYQDFPNP